MLWIGLAARFWLVPSDAGIYWDENYHICSAEKYLGGVMFMEPHPPLGKLLLAAGSWLDGKNRGVDKSLFYQTDHISDIPPGYSLRGMRSVSAAFGLLACLVALDIMRRILGGVLVALPFASLLAFDNGLLVHCRAAMLEGIQLFFVCLALWAFVRALFRAVPLSLSTYAVLAACVALAVMVKVNSGVLLLLFPCLWFHENWGCWNRDRLGPPIWDLVRKASVSLFVLGTLMAAIAYVHFGLGHRISDGRTYAASPAYLRIIDAGKTWSLGAFRVMLRDNLAYMADYQKGVPALDPTKPDENGSSPFNWMIGGRAISYRWDREGAFVRYIYLVLNPAGVVVALLALAFSLALVVSIGFWEYNPERSPQLTLVVTLLGLYLVYMAGMLRAERVLYLYHYFVPLVFAWVMAASLFKLIYAKELESESRYVHGGLALALASIILLFWFFSPLTFGRPLDTVDFSARNWSRYWGVRGAY